MLVKYLWRNAVFTAVSVLTASSLVATYDLDVDSTDSIKNVAKQMAQDLKSFYNGDEPGQTPGLLPQPYYWWEGGALMGAFIDYWYYTGDTTYNDITQQGLLFQVGPYNDYMPPNQTLTEGNDDQGFWGMAVMTAAEYKFQDPPSDKPGWLALAQAVFNTQASRWETDYCNGGLRWQIFKWNNGFTYKNSISQACFFNLASRLALYTGNSTYADWAVKTWDWMRIYDGAHIDDNCTTITPYEFSYNVGAFLLGTAAMTAYSNTTNNSANVEMWRERVDGLLNATEDIFFFGNETSNRIMIEIACEPVNLCDTDQLSFKAYLSRWMAATTKWAPWTFDRVRTLLRNSAVAAAKQCTGGDNHRMCGLKWANNSGQWDGTTGVGQQMASMEVVLATMIQEAAPPVTNGTGGTSVGNPSAGGSDDGRTDPVGRIYGPISTGDKAGAAICTIIVVCSFLAALAFMVTDETRSTSDNLASMRSTLSGAATLGVLAGGAKKAMNNEKGKGIAAAMDKERSSSTDTGERIPSAYANGKLQKSMQPSEQKSLKRVSAPPSALSPVRETAKPNTIPDRRFSTNSIAQRASVLRKQRQGA
ncbi:glycoside hydrolase family 76 protein [Hypoxylon sp. FL0543]|nr:glycoside hydrolase family 76 protein [Hypoxylon sp. FL0543]